MLSKQELLKYFGETDAEKLKQQLIALCCCIDNNEESTLKFLNRIYCASTLPMTNKCYLIKSIIEQCIDGHSFSIDLVFLINSFIVSIPIKSLKFHLDFTNYDSMNIYHDNITNINYLKSTQSIHNKIIFKSINTNYPILNDKEGYIHFNNKQILVSQSLFTLYKNNGITLIILFRCYNVENNIKQQFLFNFGNGYAASYKNMEIGINAGCDPDYNYDERIKYKFGVHSGRGLALTSLMNTNKLQNKLQNNKWYLITMFIRSNNHIEFFINGSNQATNTMYQWNGYNNNQSAPIDIGGRIDGNWIANTVYAHNKININHTHCNCFFYGDISSIILYDRIITLNEKNQIEKPLLNRYKM